MTKARAYQILWIAFNTLGAIWCLYAGHERIGDAWPLYAFSYVAFVASAGCWLWALLEDAAEERAWRQQLEDAKLMWCYPPRFTAAGPWADQAAGQMIKPEHDRQ